MTTDDVGQPMYRARWAIGALFLTSSAVAGVACLSGSEPAATSGVEAARSALSAPTVPVKTSWLQYGGDSTHSGSNPFESTIGVDNVAQLPASTLWSVTLPASNLSGGHDTSSKLPSTPVIDGVNNTAYFVAAGNFYALDSNTGACKWAIGPNDTGGMQCNFFLPWGFTSTGNDPAGTGRALNATPAIDPSLGYVYFAAEDVHSTNGQVAGYIHKFTSAGTEVVVNGVWPALYNKKIWGANHTGGEPATPALSIGYAGATGPYYLYVGSGDCDSTGSSGDCEGKVTTINLGSGSQKVWNAICSDLTSHFGSAAASPSQDACAKHGGGVWAKAGITFDPLTQKMFFGTAEGASYSPSTHIWGLSAVALHADGTGLANGYPVDSYASHGVADPTGTATTGSLTHMGHGHMIVLQNNNSSYPRLGLISGKEGAVNYGSLSLLNLDNMGGGGTGATGKELAFVNIDNLVSSVSGSGAANVLSTEPAATWVNPADGSTWVYISYRVMTAGKNLGLYAFRLSVDGNGKPSLEYKWRDPSPYTGGGWAGGAFVANGVAYYSNGFAIKAFDAVTGTLLATFPNGARRTPVVVNGVLYTVNTTTLTAYAVQKITPPDVAAGKWAVTSSILAGSGIPDTATNGKRATDNNLSGAWSSGSVFHTSNENNTVVTGHAGGPYWYVDLGTLYNVKQVALYNRTDDCGGTIGNCANRLSRFWINYYDGSSWRVGSDQSQTMVGNPADRSNSVNVFSNNVLSIPTSFITRYVMVQLANADYLHLGEVQVFADPSTTRINCGESGDRPPFVGDIDYSGGSQRTRTNTIDLSFASNPAPMAVYQSQRYGTSFSYTVPGFQAGSSHLVRLHFAETNPANNAAGKRKFSVAINGTTQISNLDLFATVGLNEAYVKEFTLNANGSGQYVISFTTSVDAATISAIEVL